MEKISSIFHLNFSILAVTVAVCSIPAETVAKPTQELEKQQLLKHLAKTQNDLLSKIKNLSIKQARFKPEGKKWSVLEVIEHMVIVEDILRSNVSDLLAEPAPKELLSQAQPPDIVLKQIYNRNNRIQAAKKAQPKGRYKNLPEAITAVNSTRNKTIALLKEHKNLNQFAKAHHRFGTLDTYGWSYLISGHLGRHTLQIQDILDHAQFPKKQ